MAKRSHYYPVFLYVAGRKCVVVGGGQVALRKVKALVDCRAGVEVISPDLCPGLVKLAEDGKIKARRRNYRAGDLRGALIAISATDNNEVNREVVQEARESGVLINVVDGAADSDFIAPAHLRRGDITIAVSSGGASPALTRKIRARLEIEFSKDYALLATLIGQVRREAKRRGLKIDAEDWQQALDLDSLIALVKKGDREKAKAVLRARLLATRSR